jgi:hypothetical protein
MTTKTINECMNCGISLRDSNYFSEYIGFVCFKCSNLSKANYYLKVCEKLKEENRELKIKIKKLQVNLRDFCISFDDGNNSVEY